MGAQTDPIIKKDSSVSMSPFLVARKPLAGRVVQKKPIGDNEEEKTPFVVKWRSGLATATTNNKRRTFG